MSNQQNILTDNFGRAHDYLRISLTERCNLRCFYCMPAEGIPLRDKAHFMRTEEILFIAKTFVNLGVKKIRLTGGEPLVRKDAANIIRQLSELPVELGISTNGILVDQHIDTFEEAGIRTVNVSLDSLKQERTVSITRRDHFTRIMSNIELLINRGFEVKINTVLMRGTNDDEITDFIEWTRKSPVNVRFIEFMPFGGNNWDWSKGVSLDEILTKTTEHFGTFGFERIADKPNDTSKNYQLKGAEGTFAIISSVTNPFCDTCNRIRLTADGKIKNCLFSNNETDLLSALRNGQEITSLIRKNVLNKKAIRAGMDSLKTFSDPHRNQNNRSMIAIGG
ncbi:MAG: GTP 3',8-cyclase MoaA [Flavobacteriales bacterium]|nr:GTP 3',8-cyclase MoaA [Flavobacteriales bacterium]